MSKRGLLGHADVSHIAGQAKMRLVFQSTKDICLICTSVQVSPEKYCSLVIEEGGLAVLETMLNSNAEFEVRPDVRTFAEMVR